ncbi:hypothetical protein H1C71_038648, partial [Ictidomys tridecemlineatus]
EGQVPCVSGPLSASERTPLLYFSRAPCGVPPVSACLWVSGSLSSLSLSPSVSLSGSLFPSAPGFLSSGTFCHPEPSPLIFSPYLLSLPVSQPLSTKTLPPPRFSPSPFPLLPLFPVLPQPLSPSFCLSHLSILPPLWMTLSLVLLPFCYSVPDPPSSPLPQPSPTPSLGSSLRVSVPVPFSPRVFLSVCVSPTSFCYQSLPPPNSSLPHPCFPVSESLFPSLLSRCLSPSLPSSHSLLPQLASATQTLPPILSLPPSISSRRLPI